MSPIFMYIQLKTVPTCWESRASDYHWKKCEPSCLFGATTKPCVRTWEAKPFVYCGDPKTECGWLKALYKDWVPHFLELPARLRLRCVFIVLFFLHGPPRKSRRGQQRRCFSGTVQILVAICRLSMNPLKYQQAVQSVHAVWICLLQVLA